MRGKNGGSAAYLGLYAKDKVESENDFEDLWTKAEDMGLEDVETAANLVQEAAHPDANIIFGASFDPSLDDEIRVTVIATGFDEASKAQPAVAVQPAAEKTQGLYTAAATAAAQEAQPAPAQPAASAAAPAAPAAEEDPFDSIFKIFNSK